MENVSAAKKLLLYADDVLFTVQDRQWLLREMMKVLALYGSVPGYKVNETKSVLTELNIQIREK